MLVAVEFERDVRFNKWEGSTTVWL